MKARLELQLDLERRRLFDSVLAEIIECVMVFGITERDIFQSDLTRTRKRRKAKYFDPITGSTWSGVGREPHWIKGRDRAEFVIDEADSEQ
ncbi:TPA: H-NS histone family protein [Burkholderia cenocepacia]|nr:H-NS histone family protein [Burkholderia cenocepacia]